MKILLLGFIFLLSCSSSPPKKKHDKSIVPKFEVGTCFFKGGVQIEIKEIKDGEYHVEIDLPIGIRKESMPFKQAEKKIKEENLKQKACK